MEKMSYGRNMSALLRTTDVQLSAPFKAPRWACGMRTDGYLAGCTVESDAQVGENENEEFILSSTRLPIIGAGRYIKAIS